MIDRKVIVVGVDGATWDVIDPLLEKGELPGFERLVDGGVRADLMSIPSTFTSLVWPTIATGKFYDSFGIGPSVHGRYSIDTLHLWDILEAHDMSIGLMNWHGSYPPRETNGFYIPGGQLNQGFTDTYPERSNYIKILRNLRDAPRDVPPGQAIRSILRYAKTPPSLQTLRAGAQFLKAKLGADHAISTSYSSMLSQSVLTDVYLSHLESYDPDFSTIYLNAPDIAAHKTWNHYEPDLYPNENSGEYDQVIPDAYRETDRCLRRIISATGDDTTIVVLSDHGTGPAGNGSDVFAPDPDVLVEMLDTDLEYIRLKNCVYFFAKNESTARDAKRSLNAITAGGEPLFAVEQVRDPTIEVAVPGKPPLEDSLDSSDHSVRDVVRVNDFRNQWGTHEDSGIFLANGPDVGRDRTLDPLHVTDVTPTLLYYFGVPVGDDMDGDVRPDVFTDEFAARQVETIKTHDEMPYASRFIANRQDANIDESEVRDRLENLGYL